MFIIDHNQLVSPLYHTKYIICSSLLFLGPSIYAFQKEQYLMTISLFVAAIMSINHWRYPTYSWRRIADHISSKILFIIFFVNGLLLATDPIFVLSELICLFLFIYCFYMSDKYCNYNINIHDMDPCWWKYHVLFHLFGVCSQLIIIYSI
jgi:hypothetical protein